MVVWAYEYFDEMGFCAFSQPQSVLQGVEALGLLGQMNDDNRFFKAVVWLDIETEAIAEEGRIEIFKPVAGGRCCGVFKETLKVFPRGSKGEAQGLKLDLFRESLKA